MPESSRSDQEQTGGGAPQKGSGEGNRGADFGASEPSTAGTDRDADPSGESKNEGHGHTNPRKE